MKIRRLFTILLVAVLIIGAIPLSAAAASGSLICGLDEHTHDDSCYSLTCTIPEHPQHSVIGGGCYTECTPNGNSGHWVWMPLPFSSGVWLHYLGSCQRVGQKYYFFSCPLDLHTHDPAKPGDCYSLTCELEEHTHVPGCYEYDYQVNVYYIDAVSSATVATGAPIFGSFTGDESPYDVLVHANVPAGYRLATGETTPKIATFSAEFEPVYMASLTQIEPDYGLLGEVNFYVTAIPRIPPQVIIPEPSPEPTPVPTPEQEIPPEEIPLDEPEEEIIEEDEVPTDVPETGDSTSLLPVIALFALAGAAFVLTFKKSRKDV